MGVRKKGKRRIVVDDRTLWWRVGPDEFYLSGVLSVVSDDKSLMIKYGLAQSEELRSVAVFDRAGGPGSRGTSWYRYLCPKWGRTDRITPGDVAEVVRWCTNERSSAIEVDWEGREISNA